jgi:ubiquinone/menaquinone biosynthesis C-methylase UbiE
MAASGSTGGPHPVAGAGDSAEAKERVLQAFGQIASTYGSGLELFDVFGRDLVAAAAIRAGERVLDLACGRGACVWPASEAVGVRGHVLGIDLSPTMVELATEGLRRDNISNAEFRVGDAEHLELANESFDVVMCGFGVFLFPKPEVAVMESRRVLHPGGRFVASTFGDGVLDYPWLVEVVEEIAVGSEMESQLRGAAAAMRRPLLNAEGMSQILSEARFEGVAITTSERRFVFCRYRCVSAVGSIPRRRCGPQRAQQKGLGAVSTGMRATARGSPSA